MHQLYCFCFVLGFYLVSAAVVIKKLDIPQSIDIEAAKDVILDCDFEPGGDRDIEVKWYHNGDENLIYQWLPAQDVGPKATGPFKDIIDVNYKISNDPKTQYRALYIRNLTSEVSGNYTCKISGLESEDTGTKRMIIYKPSDSELELDHNETEKTIECSASGMFPQPEMRIYVRNYVHSNNTPYLSTSTNKDKGAIIKDNDSFNISLQLNYNHTTLTSPSEIVCELLIPLTDYHINATDYYQSVEDMEDAARSGYRGLSKLKYLMGSTSNQKTDSTKPGTKADSKGNGAASSLCLLPVPTLFFLLPFLIS